jgi:sialidase-1
MKSLKVCESGLIYRNPKPHVVSRHAYFPSLCVLPNGDIFAAFDLGSAFEAADVRSHYVLSRDRGATWSVPVLVPLPDFPEPFSCTCRFRGSPEGELVGIGALWDRTRSDEGLANPETGGFVETFPFLVRADASTLEWRTPSWIETPLKGPFEICSPVFFTPSGECLWPASTQMNWDGNAEQGMQSIVMRSPDNGKTWPSWNAVMDGRSDGISHWEIKFVDLRDGRLLAVCWTHDSKTGADLPIHYALSSDEGRTFSSPASTGLRGQTCTPLVLNDGQILSVYRRSDRPGLWAQISTLDGETWVNHGEELLWGGVSHASGPKDPKFATTTMSTLRFGLPTSVLLHDGTVLVAFWCVEDAVSVIRYFKIDVQNESH